MQQSGTGLVPMLTRNADQLTEQAAQLMAPNVIAKIRESQAGAKCWPVLTA